MLRTSELGRIKDKVSSWKNPAPTKAAQLQKQKEMLHQQSQHTVQKWQNTIEGQRLKRLQAHKLKVEQEEVSSPAAPVSACNPATTSVATDKSSGCI